MANIPRLPTGADLIEAEPKGVTRSDYGPYLGATEDSVTQTVSLFGAKTGEVVATVTRSGGGAHVDLDVLNRIMPVVAAAIIPYVNRFIEGSGTRVEKYWRTKTYRLVGGVARATVTPTRKSRASKPVTKKSRASKPVTKVALATVAPITEVAHRPLKRGEVRPFKPAVPVIDNVAEDIRITALVAENHPALVETFTPDDTGDIPGVEHPAKVSVKAGLAGTVKVGQIVIPEADHRTLTDAWALRQSGVPASVLITGPSGTAKTALVRAFAASLGVPFLKVDGGAIRTADDWAGAFRQDPNTKTWAHRWSPMARCLQRGTPMVILIDEITRTESTQALNGLLGLLDWTGSLLVPDANTVLTMPAGILVIATANIGPEYVGTLPLDGAVRQRFPHGVRMGYPVEKVEVRLISEMTGVDETLATRLVKMADTQRQNREDPAMYPSGSIISTRVLIDIARRIATCSTEPREAVWATLRGQFDPGDERALSVAVDTQFPAASTALDEIIDEVAPDDADWDCPQPSCGRTGIAAAVTSCPWCGYVRPTGAGATIRLQNRPYPQP